MSEMILPTAATIPEEQSTERVGMSVEDFARAYAEQPFELIDGERIPLMATKFRHGTVIRLLRKALDRYLAENPVAEFFTEMTFTLSEESNWVRGSRQPDLMIYEIERLNEYASEPARLDEPLRLMPDWVIEVISEHDGAKALGEKRLRYIAEGVRLVWVVDPFAGEVVVHSGEGVQLLTADAELNGVPVLPDFRLTLREVLPPAPERDDQ